MNAWVNVMSARRNAMSALGNATGACGNVMSALGSATGVCGNALFAGWSAMISRMGWATKTAWSPASPSASTVSWSD